eukprot:SAG31_NODE_4714_length_3012_cov_26.602815_3_plen_228_part_00
MLGAMKAIVELGLKVNVLGCLVLAENSIDADAQHPYDIVKSYKGLTIHIDNTDAEGRLVLADAITYAQRNFGQSQQSGSYHHSAPIHTESYDDWFADGVDTIFDFATLTGACVVALGEYCAGVWSNDDGTAAAVAAAAEATSTERVWRMPLYPEHYAELKHPECDLKHTGAGRAGGANTAAAFIGEFIEDGVNWCHFDIAGCSGTSGGLTGNGWGVDLICQYLKRRS